jgi:hypothetical protein
LFLQHCETVDSPGRRAITRNKISQFCRKNKKPPSWATNQNDWDRFADTDINGETGQRLMRALAAKKVDYTFLELVPFTQKMTNQFRDWYNGSKSKHLPMEVVPCSKPDLIPDLVAKQVLASIKAVQLK